MGFGRYNIEFPWYVQISKKKNSLIRSNFEEQNGTHLLSLNDTLCIVFAIAGYYFNVLYRFQKDNNMFLFVQAYVKIFLLYFYLLVSNTLVQSNLKPLYNFSFLFMVIHVSENQFCIY